MADITKAVNVDSDTDDSTNKIDLFIQSIKQNCEKLVRKLFVITQKIM